MSKLDDIVKFSDDLLEKINSEIYKKAEEVITSLEDWFTLCVHLDGHGIPIPDRLMFLRLKDKVLPNEPWIVIYDRIIERNRITSFTFENDPFAISVNLKQAYFTIPARKVKAGLDIRGFESEDAAKLYLEVSDGD